MDLFTERTPRVVSASKLHRAAARRRQARFLAEGVNSVEAALESGVAQELFCTESARSRFGVLMEQASAGGVPVSLITDSAARSLADTITPTGIFAVCVSVARDCAEWASGESGVAGDGCPRLIAIGQALAEPGNVGTLIRVSDALGAEAVWLTGGAADPENPKAVRASAGSLFHLPVIRGFDEATLVDRAHAVNLQVLVAAGDGEVDIEDADDLLARPTAWVFGNEAHGVPSELADSADARVRIPIRGRAESLNIVTAASICIFESVRAQNRSAR